MNRGEDIQAGENARHDQEIFYPADFKKNSARALGQ